MTTVLEELNAALFHAFQDDSRVYLLGEDVLDPYGGAFKVTRGLSSVFPERLITTPISEAGIVGVAAGMAMRGLRPIVEIMFGDFLTLAADQIVNHITKFRWMYNEQVHVPLTIRTPMGGRRGYGPTHSQTLEKLFLGVPGLQIIAPSTLGDPGVLLYNAVLHNENPSLFIENKLLYLLPVLPSNQPDLNIVHVTSSDFNPNVKYPESDPLTPAYMLTVKAAPKPKLTLVAYGYMAELARQALVRLAYEHEIFAELYVPTKLVPVDLAGLLESVRLTSRLLTIEEGSLTSGWGAEVIARMTELLGGSLKVARRVAAWDNPIPSSGPLEIIALPGVEEIIRAARLMV